MEVTLRKAATFEAALRDAAKSLTLTKQISVSIYTDSTVAELVTAAQDKLKANLADATALYNAAFEVRGQIAEANAARGVSKLLTEKAQLDATEKTIASVAGTKHDAYDEVVDSTIAQAQLDALAQRIKSGTQTYGRETIDVTILSEELIASLKSQLATISRRKSAITDELLGLNMFNKIVLSESTVALLKKHSLV